LTLSKINVKNFSGVGCSLIEEPSPQTIVKTSHPRGSAKSRIWGTETLKPIATIYNILHAGCRPSHANFGEDRLRGFGVARGRILAFSIDLLRRL